jgi:hypothetical protein
MHDMMDDAVVHDVMMHVMPVAPVRVAAVRRRRRRWHGIGRFRHRRRRWRRDHRSGWRRGRARTRAEQRHDTGNNKRPNSVNHGTLLHWAALQKGYDWKWTYHFGRFD